MRVVVCFKEVNQTLDVLNLVMDHCRLNYIVLCDSAYQRSNCFKKFIASILKPRSEYLHNRGEYCVAFKDPEFGKLTLYWEVWHDCYYIKYHSNLFAMQPHKTDPELSHATYSMLNGIRNYAEQHLDIYFESQYDTAIA